MRLLPNDADMSLLTERSTVQILVCHLFGVKPSSKLMLTYCWLDRSEQISVGLDQNGAIFINKNVHEDVIKWIRFPRYWPFVRGIHRSPVNSPHKGQWRGTLVFSLICARINCWVNNLEACDLRHHRAHYDVIVVYLMVSSQHINCPTTYS